MGDNMGIVDQVEELRKNNLNNDEITYILRRMWGYAETTIEDAIMVADAKDERVLEA